MHNHTKGERCTECGYGTDLFQPFKDWFRQFSKPMQWLMGLPFCYFASTKWYDTVTHVPKPGEPRLAFWVTLILFVVSLVLSELLRPKPNIENARPSGLGDFQFPTATEGRPVPIVWGTVRQKGPNVIWYGDLVQEPILEKIKTGMWSSETITKGFTYSVGVQFALCRGTEDTPVTLKRVWIGEDEVFSGTVSSETTFDIDKPDLFGGRELGTGGVQATCDFFPGTRTQSVSTWLDQVGRQQITTAATPTAPRYSGTCYVLARELTGAAATGTEFGALMGTSTTIKPWSFEVARFPLQFSGQSGTQNVVNSVDANPINVIYELLTNDEFGFGFEAADIDVGSGSSFLNASINMVNEGNGFSLLLDREQTAKDLLQELQRQIEGVVYLSQTTGKWTIQLARGADDARFGYDIDLVPQLTDANVSEVRDYTRGSWEDTTNTIRVGYDKRDDNYKQSFALAQDTANAMIQGDGTIANAQSTTGSVSFPGVKDSALASNLAWRELRGQSYPLARCTLVANRESHTVSIGDVVAWTNTKLGFNKLPMRVTRVDYGLLQSNRMVLTVVQDVFEFAAASMGTPVSTGWTPPTVTFADFPADERVAFEAPRGILVRDPLFVGDSTVSKVLTSARRQSNEIIYQIRQRNAAGAPSGSYAEAGNVYGFMRIGELDANLGAGTSNPNASITITATPDSQTRLEAAFDDSTTLAELGSNLVQLVLVNDEFMLVKAASVNGINVDLDTVYRGVLDSVQGNHSAGDPVYLIHLGAGLTDTVFDNTNNVDIKLAMRSSDTQIADASLTAISLTMDKRAIRPYAPGAVLYNGSGSPFNTPNLEDNGTGENGQQFAVDWWRRRYDAADEVAEVTSDNAVDTSTEYQVRVFVDPSGSNTEIASSPFAWQTGADTVQVPRGELIDIAAAGTEIRVQIQARHDIGTETSLTSRNSMLHDVTPTSTLSGLFYLGGQIAATVASNSYTVATAGVHTITVGAAHSSTVQHRINGGSWISSLTTASLSISDTIEVRTASSGSPDGNFVDISNPSATRVAYGTFSS